MATAAGGGCDLLQVVVRGITMGPRSADAWLVFAQIRYNLP